MRGVGGTDGFALTRPCEAEVTAAERVGAVFVDVTRLWVD